MTTFTVDATVNLPKTHFRDVDELSRFFIEWQFEQKLEESIKKWMNTPTVEFDRA